MSDVTLRPATMDDAGQIGELMRASIQAIFPRFYDERQTASCVEHIGRFDPAIVADGTYLVHEADGRIVASGGWSRRGLLYTGSGDRSGDDRLLDPATEAAHVRAMFVHDSWTRRGLGRAILEAARTAARAEGFTRLDLMATLPGVPLYRAFGFVEVEQVKVTLADGMVVAGVAMERAIDG